MAAPILYRAKQRWQIWAAFGGAALIHLGAIALAENKTRDLPPAVIDYPGIPVEIAPEPQDSPAPETFDLSPEPRPPVRNEESVIPEEHPTPPPIRRLSVKPAQPIVRPASTGSARALNMRSARVLAVSAPRPEYPYEARRRRITGSGIAVLKIETATGNVIDVSMSQSTGSPVLDNATVSAFRRWRFKPGTNPTVQSPITYTLTGAEF